MALMIWDEKYSVGVKSIDDQHSVLFEAINALHAAMMRGDARKMTGPLLRDLLAYTREHFSAEEKILAAAQYPQLPEHRAKHKDLTDHVAGYVQSFERGELSLSLHLLNFLRDWLGNHILKVDRQYAPWVSVRKNPLRTYPSNESCADAHAGSAALGSEARS
jgi:hemerythrin